MTKIAELDTYNTESGTELEPILDVAVIGAGIAGLTAANELNRLGFTVGVFEKARGTGGRLSSKRIASIQHENRFMAFDLGCASIMAESAVFTQQLQDWHLKGVVAPWCVDKQGKSHYVAVSRNSALTRHLSKDLECQFSKRIVEIEQIEGVWHLFMLQEHVEIPSERTLLARAKKVIIAAPPAQAHDLLPITSSLKSALKDVQVSAQWVMAVEVNNSVADFPVIQHPDSEVIFSITQESNKPGRSHEKDGNTSIILQVQASPSWTNNHLESTPDQVTELLLEALEIHFGQPLDIVNHYAHRWLYSCITKGVAAKDGFLWDEQGLGLIGDYINNDFSGIESAWLSGKQMAEWIGQMFSDKLLSEQIR